MAGKPKQVNTRTLAPAAAISAPNGLEEFAKGNDNGKYRAFPKAADTRTEFRNVGAGNSGISSHTRTHTARPAKERKEKGRREDRGRAARHQLY